MSDAVGESRDERVDDTADDAGFVSVRNLESYYVDDRLVGGKLPVRAVDGVSFDVERGETVGIVGESGCGKTTLGRTLIGLKEATAGEIRIGGTDVTDVSGEEKRRWQRDAQMVFQDPQESLNDRMTVSEIIREPLDAHDWGTKAERRERVFEFLDRVGLKEDHYYRYPTQFSGGQRQRIALARALVLEPDFVVLDEPVSALDVSVQARIINLLEDLQAELDLTYLFIAHDLSVVRHICDRVAVMYLGNIVERGPTEELFTDPQHPYTVSLLSAIPGERTASSDIGRERITLRGSPPNPRDPPAGCPFATRCPAKVRPDEFDLTDDTWTAIEEFRAVLRARSRADRSLRELARQLLGMDIAADEVEELRAALFEDVETLPPAVREAVDEAADRATAGDDRGAAEHLHETFGSVCDREYPDARDVGEDRSSRCVRHDADYEDVMSVIDRRHAGD